MANTRRSFEDMSEEERRELGRKGGVASGKARRARRVVRDAVSMILLSKAESESERAILESFGLKPNTKRAVVAVLGLYSQVVGKGDARAFAEMVKMLDEGIEQGNGADGGVVILPEAEEDNA